MDDRLLSPRDFARESGLHPETVRRLCRQGDLPAIRYGKRGAWRIPANAVKRAAPVASSEAPR